MPEVEAMKKRTSTDDSDARAAAELARLQALVENEERNKGLITSSEQLPGATVVKVSQPVYQKSTGRSAIITGETVAEVKEKSDKLLRGELIIDERGNIVPKP